MASYSVSSTKSYMQAMQPMMDILSQLEISSDSKLPMIDNEDSNITSLDQLLDQFKELETDFEISDSDIEVGTNVLDEVKQQCEKIVQNKPGTTAGDLVDAIISTLAVTSSDEELQSLLFDILGFEEFELISKIIQDKEEILDLQNQSLDEDRETKKFMTEDERGMQLKENFQRTQNQPLLEKSQKQKYPHVFQTYEAGNTISFTGKKYALPMGTTRESRPTYEEIVIPYPKKRPMKFSERLVPVSELDVLCQGTFKGYDTLNRMQSLVYPVAYNTNENMLVCAPTGAGKTDVAMLTILNVINQFTEESEDIVINCDNFKIVYVAPLKALAAEIVEKFSKKLQWLGIIVRELTGDMQLTKAEISATQVIVTTPEKWDVVTRKANGDSELVEKVKLLIIDEVHLLHEERGSVIETLVARTLRQVESSQSMIRILGLSATLPNYIDVADFLGVNRQIGMFYFDQSFRPVPLKQELIGVKGKAGSKQSKDLIDQISYDKLVEMLHEGHQIMVFLHSRKDTIKTARTYISMAHSFHDESLFDCSENDSHSRFTREMSKNRNKDMRELFAFGFGVHHAGMLRADRNLTEKMFMSGAIKVLCCTATLAWGVNLPAAVVIVKGTQVYDSKRGGFVDLGISDVIQIFGRAGRPQFEKYGTGILCTSSDRLDHYVSLITQQHPIESRLSDKLVDNLNAEISLGTVTNIEEGIQWLGYTYMMVRMRQNPFAYGIDWRELEDDPQLRERRRNMIVSAARRLHTLQMIIFDERSGAFIAKDLGRIASDFYLLNNSVEIFNQMINPKATEADVLSMISMSAEFDSIKFREEEAQELKSLSEDSAPCQVGGEPDSAHSKTNVLLQAYVSKAQIKDSALVSDSNYVAQNSSRICRALFLMGINRKWGIFSKTMLSLCKAIDRRIWAFDHPLTQFDLPQPVLRNLEAKNPSMESLRDMDSRELGDLVHNSRMGSVLYKLIGRFPHLFIDAEVFPITTNVLRVHVDIEPDFVWDDRYHGNAQIFWVLVEESDKSEILHFEKYVLNRKQMRSSHEMDFMIPLADPAPPQVVVRIISDNWIGSESVHAISFQQLIRPHNETIRTNLLRLQPLPVKALHNKEVEKIYSSKFRYFNPMQTMAFHSLYNTNSSIFVGSPTGSGKTIVAELAIWHAFRDFPGSKVVYIAPMKALVRERVDDWTKRICRNTSYKLVELTGDSLPDAKDVREADIIVTTPEKFDGISRNWQTRKFVQEISLVIMDEIHLLASDRGPILEMIVSRMNYISSQTKSQIRLLGMSTAVSNAMDMAGWLGVKEGLFNFPQSVRPVPLQMYIDGFPDNLAFCPLMKTMNKPAFMAIKQHSPNKPVLIFVASRRQTRLTALDLIHLCGMEDNPRRFLKMNEDELNEVLKNVKDDTLRLSLQFGMGLHHAGLVESDRQISHKLFESGKIQILVATSTLAWGVNLPAHLVIIKGTQFFDAKIEGYRDMDLTDILQMMGRAGRPAFDTSGIAFVYTKESKKGFYKHFLNIGFPVESSLHKVLDDHLGAEISSGTIKTRQDAMDFLTWTFLYRRAHNNPTFYGITDTSTAGVSKYLTDLIDSTIDNLKESRCVLVDTDELIEPTPFLHISSYYYLSHKTIRNLTAKITRGASFRNCLQWLAEATEYNELATRHGEELINMEMSREMRYPADDLNCEFIWDPHVKAYLLVQAYVSRVELPIADYAQDTVAVLDQSLRILQAYIDAAAELGYLSTVLNFAKLMQCIKQCCWYDDDPIFTLPGLILRPLPEKEQGDEDEDVNQNDGESNALPSKGSKSSNSSSTKVRRRTTLNDLGKMGYGKLSSFADTIGVAAEHKKAFLDIAAKLPTGNLSVSQSSAESVFIELLRDNDPINAEFKVYCPKFPKPQRETWLVIVCDEQNDELFLMKRASPKSSPRGSKEKAKVVCSLDIPVALCGSDLTIMVVSDFMDIQYSTKHKFIK